MCSVGHFSFKLLLFVHCLSLLLCPCAYSSDRCCVTCMTSVILLTFSSSTLTVWDLSLCLVSHAFMCSHRSRRGCGPDFLMFTQMCFISGAVLDEQNVITCCMYSLDYDFLFSCFFFFISLSLLQHIALWKAFCECLFPPGCPFFIFKIKPLWWFVNLRWKNNDTLIWACLF